MGTIYINEVLQVSPNGKDIVGCQQPEEEEEEEGAEE